MAGRSVASTFASFGAVVAGLAAAGALFAAQPARADVLEIADDGTVKVRAGVGAVAWGDGKGEPAPAGFDLPAEALTLIADAPTPINYAVHVNAVAERNGLSPALLEALVWQESRWRPTAVSPKGAQGLAQLMPATARELGVDPRDPLANLEGGARYLRQQLNRFGGDVERALAAYNAGPGRVQRAGGIPNIPETRAYVAAVMGRLQAQAVSR
jgi:soluble lytic murein transglycosylase-like protein